MKEVFEALFNGKRRYRLERHKRYSFRVLHDGTVKWNIGTVLA